MARVLVLAFLTIWSTTLGIAMGAQSDRPRLSDRYAESWGGKVDGPPVPLDTGQVLTMPQGQPQRMDPLVGAPRSHPLTNVTLELCLPLSWTVTAEIPQTIDPATDLGPILTPRRVGPVWTLQDRGRCARYTTPLRTINPGTWVNPPAPLVFTVSQPGRYTIRYTISTEERAPIRGIITVQVRGR